MIAIDIRKGKPVSRPLPTTFYTLAFDHRQVLRDQLGKPGEDRAEQHARFAEGKQIALDGLLRAVGDGVRRESACFLVDEEYGGEVARRARDAGVGLAMPVEASRTPTFEFQYGDAFDEHVHAFAPDIVKALVFHNPADPPERRQEQTYTLRRLSAWTARHGFPFMLELLVRPTRAQAARVDGDEARFRDALLPQLTCDAIAQLQAANVEPNIWKLEGLDNPASGATVTAQCRRDGRDNVSCIVLGGGVDLAKAAQWVTTAASVHGFRGFAIGRSLWEEPLRTYYRGERTRAETARSIGQRFTRLVSAYESAG